MTSFFFEITTIVMYDNNKNNIINQNEQMSAIKNDSYCSINNNSKIMTLSEIRKAANNN